MGLIGHILYMYVSGYESLMPCLIILRL